MGKKFLREEQMSDVAVNQAASWARVLTQCESRGPGDLPNAWRRLEARYGVPVQTFWALRYRRPKDILASIYLQLSAAYQAECQRQMRKLAHEIHITRRIAGADHPAVAQAQAVVDKANGRPEVARGVLPVSAPVQPYVSAPTDEEMEFPEFLRRT
jgi:hypothetical protein